jgi:Arc/MetJ family transcription regulator
MKRTNLVLDEQLLEDATRVLGAKTYSEAVNRALAESLDLARARGLLDLVGKGAWSGRLSEMREDRIAKPAHRKSRAR